MSDQPYTELQELRIRVAELKAKLDALHVMEPPLPAPAATTTASTVTTGSATTTAPAPTPAAS